MAHGQLAVVLRHLRQLIGAGPAADLTDAQLLEQFARLRNEAAFTTLVRRYGPLVLGLCQRVLRNGHDAEDAFQATFLVLARKAGSIRKQESVGSWLYGVAYRIAQKAKLRAGRRWATEHGAAEPAVPLDGSAQESRPVTHDLHQMPDRSTLHGDPTADLSWCEVRAVLDEELHRLPEKYRAPIVLCYLEQRTHDEAAQRLGWPRGSLAKRLTRALELLGERLSGRGVALSVALLPATLAANATAAVPATLEQNTVQAAVLFATPGAAAGAMSTEAVELAKGLLSSTLTAKLKLTAVALVLVGLVGTGAGVLAARIWTEERPADVQSPLAAVTTPSDVPLDDGGLAAGVEQRVDQWQPTRAERRFDEIGWARDLRDAQQLAKKHGRLIVLLRHGGKIATGRSSASAAHMRASALSNDRVIDLLNRRFVPVHISNQDYASDGAAPAEEKVELARLRQEAAQAELSDRSNLVWIVSPDGHPVDTLEACSATLADRLVAHLERHLSAPMTDAGQPVALPAKQSRPPQAGPDAVVLHMTARYLVRQGDECVPAKVQLGRNENYGCRGCPAENWIVLEKSQWTRLLPSAGIQMGNTWDLDPDVAALLFRHMYPQTEDNDVTRNRIDQGTLKATVVARQGGVVRARLEGALKMKHRFAPDKNDNKFVTANLLGYLDFEPDRPALRSLRLVTTEATYGRSDFGIALRIVP